MDELSLGEVIVQIIEDQATEQHSARVETLWLEIGGLATVEVEAMRFCCNPGEAHKVCTVH